ncbi:MAG: DUF5689 domain-containing protein [Bacteroidota bacterium]
MLFVAASCQDEDPPVAEAAAQFTQSTLSFSESADQQQITLTLNIPAGSDGEIVLSTSVVNTSCFVTEPAVEAGQIKLPVKKGQALLSFTMKPVDNNALDGCKVVKFTITSVSSGLRKGVTSDLVVSVNDDESPVEASFELSGLNVRENAASGGSIDINFTSPAPADGVLIFSYETASTYGVDFITEPAAASQKIFLQVAKGATSASVKLYPVNDNLFKADRNISFHLVDATGGLRVGGNDALWCTITEDDGKMISPIAAVRSLLANDPIAIRDTYIEGIVTSITNVSTSRIVVEDASGAIQIQLQPDHSLTRGDVVLLNLDKGTLHLQQGVLEVSDITQFEKLGEETLRINKYSLEDLARSADNMQSQTVQITGVIFTQANGSATFLGDRPASDGARSIIVRTNSVADFGDQTIPGGPLSVTGIYVNLDGQSYIYPQVITDIRSGHTSIIRRD